jgi:hypothetical protein
MTMYPEEQEPTMEEELDEDSAPDFVDPDNLEDCTVVADLDEDDGEPPPLSSAAALIGRVRVFPLHAPLECAD